MSKFYANNVSTTPANPNECVFSRGITTRVMAKKHILQMQKDSEETRRSSLSERRTQFLSGTSVPNSTIRSIVESPTEIKVDPKTESFHSSHIDDAPLIKRIDVLLSSEERGMERMRQKIRSSQRGELSIESKEERRSSLVTPLSPAILQTPMRRPTLESIKSAIDKSPNHIMKLVNADSIERRNVGRHFKILDLDPLAKTVRIEENPEIVQKRDLQTQTSLLLEKILMQMRSK